MTQHPKESRNIFDDGTSAASVQTVTPSGVKFSNPGRSERAVVRAELSDSLKSSLDAPSNSVELSELANGKGVPSVESETPGETTPLTASNTTESLQPVDVEYHVTEVPATLPENSGRVLRVVQP